MMTDAAIVRAAALDAWDVGLSVVPPRQDGSKRPEGNWKRWTTERASRDMVESWYADGRSGVGVVCGQVSGNLEMLELEGRAADLWPEYVRRCNEAGLDDALGRIIDGYAERTPTHGIHLLYRCDTITGNLKLAVNTDGECLIETRGEGGFVIVAPSGGPVHPTGQAWERRTGGFATIATIDPAEREALHRIAASFDQRPTYEPADPPRATATDDPWSRVQMPSGSGWIAGVVEDFNDATTWDRILEGWTWCWRDAKGIDYWCRPGKDPRHGTSATTNANGTDRLIVFSSSVPGFEPADGAGKATSYDRFSAACVIRHGRDDQATRVMFARELRAEGFGPPVEKAETVDIAELLTGEAENHPGIEPVNWPAFWEGTSVGEDWLCEPLLPRGRQVALYASHKAGKSLLTLEVAAALATGRACLRQPSGEPVSVVYVDYEMTEDDLRERLEDMGYGPDDDLSNLHYYLLPSIPPLDSPEGGRKVVEVVRWHAAEAVIVDTTARAVVGGENDADTYRDYYRCTGLPLKALGVAVLRLDHAGKDAERGQRGSSAKGDDVDVVYSLLPTDNGVRLTRKVARMSWVPHRVEIERQTDPLRHVADRLGWPAGTKQLVADLDRLGVPLDASQREHREALREAGVTSANDVLRAAIRRRKQMADQADMAAWAAESDPVDKSL